MSVAEDIWREVNTRVKAQLPAALLEAGVLRHRTSGVRQGCTCNYCRLRKHIGTSMHVRYRNPSSWEQTVKLRAEMIQEGRDRLNQLANQWTCDDEGRSDLVYEVRFDALHAWRGEDRERRDQR